MNSPQHGYSVDPSSVGVVLVNWNGASDTQECLAGLLAADYTGQRSVCVVDNHSSDHSVERIGDWLDSQGFQACQAPLAMTALDARIKSIQGYKTPGLTVWLTANTGNHGFAAANNIGFKVLMAAGKPDYFWVLNNDTVPRPDALRLMVERLRANPGAGICGCTLVYMSPSNMVQAYGGVRYSFITGRGFHIGAGDFYAGPVSNTGIEQQLSYVSGASMLVTTAFVEDVGPMCEDYFLYNEELDWAWRARGRYTQVVETAAVVLHKEGASIGTESFERPPSLLADFYQARNKLLFTRRYTPWGLPGVLAFMMLRAYKRWRTGNKRNAEVILATILGRRQPDPAWFVRR